MDIRDYLRMLKRGWPVVVLVTAIFGGAATFYLAITPKIYTATSVVLFSASDTGSAADRQTGSQYISDSMSTYAQLIDSPVVLQSVADDLRPQQRSVGSVVGMVAATRRLDTALLDITATGNSPAEVSNIANLAAASTIKVIPALENTAGSDSLVQVQQLIKAAPPTVPLTPDAKRVLTIGVLVGLLFGIALTIATQALDTRIRRAHDLRRLTEIPLLAVLPHVKRRREGLMVNHDQGSASSEAFRTLRTNVRFLETRYKKSLVFTAVSDDRDRAHVPLNLAWMLAEAGQRVLLVDLDLRQSAVGDALQLESERGMSDVLAGLAGVPEVVRDTTHANLRVVLSGTSMPNPSELLSTPTTLSTLGWMESNYDYVIVHAPPLQAYSDAAVLAAAAGGTMLTVAVGRTRAHELTMGLTILANVGVIPLGVVLTRARPATLDAKKTKGRRNRYRGSRSRSKRYRFDWDWKSADSKSSRKHSFR